MSVTQIDIDGDALERAMALSGAKTKRKPSTWPCGQGVCKVPSFVAG